MYRYADGDDNGVGNGYDDDLVFIHIFLCYMFTYVYFCIHYLPCNVYGLVILCFVFLLFECLMDLCDLFTNIHQGYFTGDGAIIDCPNASEAMLKNMGKINWY